MTRRNSFIIVFIIFSMPFLQAQEREQLAIYNSGFTQSALSLWNHERTTAPYYYPAETDYDNISIYCSIGKWANSTLYYDIYTNGQYVLPSFVSIGIPIGNFMISVGYNNYYNARIHYSFLVRTPNGTEETRNYESNSKLHTFFNSIKYEANKNLSLGVLLGFNVLSESAEMSDSKISGQGYGYSLKASLLWKPTSSLSIGFNYNFISGIDYVIKDESDVTLKQVEVPGASNLVLVETEFKRKGSFPFSYNIKVGYKIQPNVSLDLSLERETWDFLDEIEADENSVFNIRFRSSFRVHEQIVLNVGYFTQNYPIGYSALSNSFIGNFYKNLQYFSVGVDYLITDSIVFNLSLFDSNQLSENKSGQTYFSSAISIEL